MTVEAVALARDSYPAKTGSCGFQPGNIGVAALMTVP